MEKLQDEIISDFAKKLDISTGSGTGEDSHDQVIKKVQMNLTPPTLSGIVTPQGPNSHTNQSLEKKSRQPEEPSSF
jgi:hypothetical protein